MLRPYVYPHMYLPASARPSAFADEAHASVRSQTPSVHVRSCFLDQEPHRPRFARCPCTGTAWTIFHLCSRELAPWLARTARNKGLAATADAQIGASAGHGRARHTGGAGAARRRPSAFPARTVLHNPQATRAGAGVLLSGARGRYGVLYIADLYNMPAAIILACEMDDNTHREMLLSMDEWKYADHPLHLQAPRQGFAEAHRTVRWCSAGLLGGLTAFGRNSGVEEVVPGPLRLDRKERLMSPLLTARVRFRKKRT